METSLLYLFPEIKCSHLQILDILSWVWLIIGTTIEWPPLCFIPVNSKELSTSTEIQVKVLAIPHIKIMPSYTLCAHVCVHTDRHLPQNISTHWLTWSILSGLGSMPGGMLLGSKAICSTSAK